MVTRRSDKQITDESDNNVVRGAFSAPSKKAAYNAFISTDNLDAADNEAEDGGSHTGAAGAGGPLVDLSAFGLTGTAEFLLAQSIRKGEAKFGWVPDTKDPDKMRQEAGARNAGPQRHPLLSESQRFDGADPKLNALPTDNPEARENFNRLANELRPTARPQNTLAAAPTFKPV